MTHYKVDSIELSDQFDISVLFENFCLSMKEYWNVRMIDQLETFSFLLSLCKLSQVQNARIVKAFLTLLAPSESENIHSITNNIYALSIYVKAHFDKNIKEYVELLALLINSNILLELTAPYKAYTELVKVLSELGDEETYGRCCEEFNRIKDNNRQRAQWVFICRIILMKFDKNKWEAWMEENIHNISGGEIFQLLYEKLLTFDTKVKKYYENEIVKYACDNTKGVITYPDHRSDAINSLLLFVILGIANEDDIGFLHEYIYTSDYIEFLFKPETFDYKKVKVFDKMWCNFINNDYYRERILAHRDEFWNEKEEKRIKLGFGSWLENRVAYKYLFD